MQPPNICERSLNMQSCLPLIFRILLMSLVCVPTLRGQDEQPKAGNGGATAAPETPANLLPLPDLTIAADADQATIEKVIETAKKIKPGSPEQYKAMQTAIRDASTRIMVLLQNKQLPRYQQAEMDAMSASVALMTYFSEASRAEIVEQVKQHLKQRPTIGISEVQLGMLAAAHLEMQANKQPAKAIYELLDELLKEDKREEMQSLRLNLQSSISRLNLLGNQFELDAKTIDKRPIKTADFAGKFVIVDFFATWCEPCLSDVPQLKKHFEKYREKGLAVLAISLDDDRAALDKYLASARLPWPIVHDDAPVQSQRLQMKFGVAALPTMLLLNKEGTVVSLEARGAELDRLMEMLFEAPTLADPPPKAAPVPKAAPATGTAQPGK